MIPLGGTPDYEGALDAALNGEIITDTGVSDEQQELLDAIAGARTVYSPAAPRAALIAKYRALIPPT